MSQGTHGLHGGSWRRKEASPQEVPEAPGATPLQEETQHRAGAWQCPNLGVEARTSPGEQNATSVRPQSLKASSRHPFYPQVVTEAQVAPVACREEEVASWTKVLVECSEVAMVETEVASVMAGAWTDVALVEEDEVPLGVPLDL